MLAVIMAYFLPEHRKIADAASARWHTPGGEMSARYCSPGRAATTVMLWVAFFFTQLVLLLMLNWLPSLIIGLGFSRTEASAASVYFGLSGSLGAVFLGHLHAGESRRRWVVATYAGMAAALAAVALVGKAFWLIAAACAVAGVFITAPSLVRRRPLIARPYAVPASEPQWRWGAWLGGGPAVSGGY
jgi:AAHS family 3-hydroxyphenylpropionic acid transporter